jgi:hypothetical protein
MILTNLNTQSKDKGDIQMSYFTEAGYTQNTVFKVINNEDYYPIGTLLTLHYDDESCCPHFTDKDDETRRYMYLPDMSEEDCEQLEVVALDGIKEGLLDEDNNLLFTTYDEWVESKEVVLQRTTTPTYEVGEIVKIVGNTCNHGFDIGEKVRITNLRSNEAGSAEYLDKHDGWAFNFKDIEKLPTETKEKEVKMIEVQLDEVETEEYKTPFEQKGYTKDSVFRYNGELGSAHQLTHNEIVVLYYDDDSMSPAFKPLSEHGKNLSTALISTSLTGYYVRLNFLTYLGEYEDFMKTQNQTDVTEQPTQTLRTPQDYRLMNPDDKIKIVVDGHESEVKLGDLISITAVGGASIGIYGYSLWSFLHETFGDITTFDGTKFDVGEKQIELFDEYFLPRKQKEIKEKLASKQKEREVLDSEIQELQSELEKL